MKKISGFTLVEVIVVVAVLAVVLTIATPDLNRLFAKQDEMTESLRLKKIYNALEVYSKQNKKLPDEGTWVNDLVQYSELSKNQIQKDVWGKNREYRRSSSTVNYLGGEYQVYYAVVHSMGYNGKMDGEITPTSQAEFMDFDPTKDSSGKRIDNQAIKYTDQADKIKLFEETLDRMEKLSIALAKYARVKQITGVQLAPERSDSFIYFPKDGRSSDGGEYFYGTIKKTVNPDTTLSLTASQSVGKISGNQNDARDLAELLGLPRYYGENALSGKPMWYISNPGDGNDICSNEPGSAPYYPPVIKIDDNVTDPC